VAPVGAAEDDVFDHDAEAAVVGGGGDFGGDGGVGEDGGAGGAGGDGETVQLAGDEAGSDDVRADLQAEVGVAGGAVAGEGAGRADRARRCSYRLFRTSCLLTFHN